MRNGSNRQSNRGNTMSALKQARPLPEVQSERAEAAAFFSGMWHGIALGGVIAAGLIVLALDFLR